MKTFTITTEPYGVFVAADGVVFAEKDNADRHGERLRALVDQANAAGELHEAMQRLTVALSWATTEERYDLEPATNHARLILGRIKS